MNVEITQRGFGKAVFEDTGGAKCSIQESSLQYGDPAREEGPMIWLGVDQLGPMEGNRKVADGRMHLSRQRVKDLLPLLQHFAETGSLP